MTSDSTTPCLPQSETDTAEHLFDNWFDPIEAGLRDRAREFLQAMLEAELEEVLGRSRYGRRRKPSDGASEDAAGITGHRHGHRSRSLLGTFGRVKIAVPRARLNSADGKTTEWKSRMLRSYHEGALSRLRKNLPSLHPRSSDVLVHRRAGRPWPVVEEVADKPGCSLLDKMTVTPISAFVCALRSVAVAPT
jgi:hypothetical protein